MPSISSFIESEITRLDRIAADQPAARPDIEELNKLFRATLLEAWGSDPAAHS